MNVVTGFRVTGEAERIHLGEVGEGGLVEIGSGTRSVRELVTWGREGATLVLAGDARNVTLYGWSGTIRAGAIRSLRVPGTLSGRVDADQIGSLRVGDMDDVTILVRDTGKALGSFRVAGAMTDSALYVQGAIGRVRIVRMRNSQIVAGTSIDPNGMIVENGAISPEGVIQRVKVFAGRGWGSEPHFQGSRIVAYRIGPVVLGRTEFFNEGTPFGITASRLSSVKFSSDEDRFRWKPSFGTLTNEDFEIRLV